MRGKLNLKWVTEAIGKDYTEWIKGDVIRLTAMPMTGKTYFVKTVLVGYAKSRGERVLLLCNRTDLKRQLKIDLLKSNNEIIPTYKDEEDNKEKINYKELDKIHTISNVTIKSYQQLNEELLDKEYFGKNVDLNYEYYVCDEIHWILSDASFASTRMFTQHIFSTIPDRINILMSATMDEINDQIEKITPKNRPRFNYSTGIDYSYLDVKYFKKDNDIINTINNDKSGSKWVVFVSDISKGRELAERVEDSHLIYAGVESDERNNIVSTGKFNCKCLITTKCMDNGINFTDEKLTNLVIYGWDKTTFLQEIGRKRLDLNKDIPTVNLYIYTRLKKSFSSKIKGIKEKKINQIELFLEDENKFNRSFNDELGNIDSRLFYKVNGSNEYKINPIGKTRVYNDLKFYEYMVKKFENEGNFAFIKEQLDWLELGHTFSEDNLIQDVIDNESIIELDKKLDRLFGEVYLNKKDREPIIEAINLIDGNNSNIKEDKIVLFSSITSLNDYLEKSNSVYRIKKFETSRIIEGKKKKFKQAWKLIK